MTRCVRVSILDLATIKVGASVQKIPHLFLVEVLFFIDRFFNCGKLVSSSGITRDDKRQAQGWPTAVLEGALK